MSPINSVLKSPRVIISTVIATASLVIVYALIFSSRNFASASVSAIVQLLLLLSPVILAAIILWLGIRPQPRALIIALVTSVCMAILFTTLHLFVDDWLAGLILFSMTLGILALCKLLILSSKQRWVKISLLLLLCIVLLVSKIAITVWLFYQMRSMYD